MQKKLFNKVLSFFTLHPRTAHNPLNTAIQMVREKRNSNLVSTDPEAKKSKETKSVLGRIIVTSLIAAVVIMPFALVHAAAYVTLSSFSGHPTTLQVSGGGWSAGETVSLYLNSASGSPSASAVVGSDSFFGPTNLVIPSNTPQGNLPIIAVGSSAGMTQSNSYYVAQFTPTLTTSASPNTPGGINLVSGTGFAPGETVNLVLNGATGGHATADTSGNFANASFTIPSVGIGTYQLHGIGASSGADAINYFYVGGFYPAANPSTYYLLPGDTLRFSGGGFAPGETVKIFANTGASAVSTFTASATGNFTDAGGYAIPATAPGGVQTFHVKSLTTGADIPIMVTVGSFNSLVTPDNYFVIPGQVVKFYGLGFASNEPIQVFLGTSGTPLTTLSADIGGGFSAAGNVTVPFSAAGTNPMYRFVGQNSHTSSTVNLTVGTFSPLISPSEFYLTPGKKFTVWGTGFAPGEIVNVSASGSAFPVITDIYGVFKTSGPFTAPFSAGPVHITATGASSGATATVDTSVSSLYPSVSPTSYYLFPGDAISFSGIGFAPGETVRITSPASTTFTAVSDEFGSFNSSSSPISITSASGARTYTFTGQSSGAVATVTVTIAALYPLASADNYYASPGTAVNVNGSGFAGGEGVTISGGSTVVHAVANSSGAISPTSVVVPFGVTSPASITLTGDLSGAHASVPITIAPFSPQITPNTYYTAPGTAVTFTGNGFAANESAAITLNGASVGSVTTTASGTLTSAGIVIPVSATNAHFVFTGSLSGVPSSVDVGLSSFSPQISPSSWYVPAGSSITINGSGFASGESVAVMLNGASASTGTVNSLGNFVSSPITIPYSATAAHVNVTSSLTGSHLSFDVGVAALAPGINLSTYYDIGGKPLVVNGMGFGGNEPVALTFDGAALGTVTTDTSGNFTFTGTVPFGAAGNKTIQARGSNSHASATANFTQPQIYVNVQLGSYAGAPGDAVTFTGDGFLPNEPVNITTDRTGSAVVHSFNANAAGQFTNGAYHLPLSFTGGPLTLTITGTHSLVPKSIAYYVTGP
jgi:hypothetical protein